jgi:NADH-quinone oxidoreductase subunit J
VILTCVILGLMLASGLWTVLTRSLVRAAIGLALTSIVLTILMFQLGATMAAVFELSVCAGLITVVFISTISMTKALTHNALLAKTRDRLRRYWYLPAILLVVGAAMAFFMAPLPLGLAGPAASSPAVAAADFSALKDMLWKERQTDLLGQITIIFAGVTGVIVLFKERKGGSE